MLKQNSFILFFIFWDIKTLSRPIVVRVNVNRQIVDLLTLLCSGYRENQKKNINYKFTKTSKPY